MAIVGQGSEKWRPIFQRMMEWVLREIENVDPYIDEVLAGTGGDDFEESLRLNYQKVRVVLKKI